MINHRSLTVIFLLCGACLGVLAKTNYVDAVRENDSGDALKGPILVPVPRDPSVARRRA
jgi:hypothetical protein